MPTTGQLRIFATVANFRNRCEFSQPAKIPQVVKFLRLFLGPPLQQKFDKN